MALPIHFHSQFSYGNVFFSSSVRTLTNLTELKSYYIGLLSYYGKFLPHLPTCLAPLYQLLGKDVPWKWSSEQEAALGKSKELLTSAPLLVHYNPDLPLSLASAYGIGAALAHRMPDGSEKPIAYASRTLNSVERNYSQIEKDGLSCVFKVKRFYAYLFGRRFTLITDHKPLPSLLSCQNRHPLKRQLEFVAGLCIYRCLNMLFNFTILQLMPTRML